eukprot:13240564-Alexandrium_andersonii.AAC.1
MFGANDCALGFVCSCLCDFRPTRNPRAPRRHWNLHETHHRTKPSGALETNSEAAPGAAQFCCIVRESRIG